MVQPGHALRIGTALFGSAPVPPHSFCVVLRDACANAVHAVGIVPISRDQANGAMQFERTSKRYMSRATDFDSPTMPSLARGEEFLPDRRRDLAFAAAQARWRAGGRGRGVRRSAVGSWAVSGRSVRSEVGDATVLLQSLRQSAGFPAGPGSAPVQVGQTRLGDVQPSGQLLWKDHALWS